MELRSINEANNIAFVLHSQPEARVILDAMQDVGRWPNAQLEVDEGLAADAYSAHDYLATTAYEEENYSAAAVLNPRYTPVIGALLGRVVEVADIRVGGASITSNDDMARAMYSQYQAVVKGEKPARPL